MPSLTMTNRRFYWPNDKLMHRVEGDYYSDPKEVAGVITRLICMHDNIQDPSKVTLNSTFEEIGLNSFDIAEIMLMVETHYHIEVSDDD